MQKIKYGVFVAFVLLFAACVSTQYPTGKKRGKRKKKKCDCPDFGKIENNTKENADYLVFSLKGHLSNLNEVD